jgi:hypothetical protein
MAAEVRKTQHHCNPPEPAKIPAQRLQPEAPASPCPSVALGPYRGRLKENGGVGSTYRQPKRAVGGARRCAVRGLVVRGQSRLREIGV